MDDDVFAAIEVELVYQSAVCLVGWSATKSSKKAYNLKTIICENY